MKLSCHSMKSPFILSRRAYRTIKKYETGIILKDGHHMLKKNLPTDIGGLSYELHQGIQKLNVSLAALEKYSTTINYRREILYEGKKKQVKKYKKTTQLLIWRLQEVVDRMICGNRTPNMIDSSFHPVMKKDVRSLSEVYTYAVPTIKYLMTVLKKQKGKSGVLGCGKVRARSLKVRGGRRRRKLCRKGSKTSKRKLRRCLRKKQRKASGKKGRKVKKIRNM